MDSDKRQNCVGLRAAPLLWERAAPRRRRTLTLRKLRPRLLDFYPLHVKNELKGKKRALTGVAQCFSAGLRTKGSLVRFPVKAQAWVASQAPVGGVWEATTH